MSIIGEVDSLWRYPVKSMRGEELDEAFAGFSGVYGDRLFAFRSSASPKGFPYLTAREQQRLLQYRPHFRYPDKAARPVNLTEAEKMGANPLSADSSELIVDVETPDGKALAIDDPARSGHRRKNAGDIKESSSSARRHGRCLRCGDGGGHAAQRRSGGSVRVTHLAAAGSRSHSS